MLNEKPVSTQCDDKCDYSGQLLNETPISEYHNVSDKLDLSHATSFFKPNAEINDGTFDSNPKFFKFKRI